MGRDTRPCSWPFNSLLSMVDTCFSWQRNSQEAEEIQPCTSQQECYPDILPRAYMTILVVRYLTCKYMGMGQDARLCSCTYVLEKRKGLLIHLLLHLWPFFSFHCHCSIATQAPPFLSTLNPITLPIFLHLLAVILCCFTRFSSSRTLSSPLPIGEFILNLFVHFLYLFVPFFR